MDLMQHIIIDMIRGMNKQLHFTPQASEYLTEQSAAVQKTFNGVE